MKNLLLLLVTVLSLSFMSCEKDNVEPSVSTVNTIIDDQTSSSTLLHRVEIATTNIKLEVDSIIVSDVNGIKQNVPLTDSGYICNGVEYITTHFLISDIDISSGSEYEVTIYFKELYSYEVILFSVLLEGSDLCERAYEEYNTQPTQLHYQTYTHSITIE